MTSLHDIFSRTADAVFVIDGECEIVYQNQVFVDIFRRNSTTLLHRKCYELVCGRSLSENKCCDPTCPVGKTILTGETTDNFELTVSQGDGKPLCFSVGTFPAHNLLGKDTAIVTLRPINAPRHPASPAESKRRGGDSFSNTGSTLTRRERQILSLLAEGHSTRALANALHISYVTARNHVQHIYVKLGVHNRAEAVSYVFRNGLPR